MPLLYHAYVYLEFLILACTIYILAPYNQALQAEYNQNFELASIGFRSSLDILVKDYACLLYTFPSPRDGLLSRMPSSA